MKASSYQKNKQRYIGSLYNCRYMVIKAIRKIGTLETLHFVKALKKEPSLQKRRWVEILY